MNQLIKRESLVSQVVRVLKQELPLFTRRKWLPGERVLSKRLQVSRTTLRVALARLQSQGLIRAHPQRGYRITGRLQNQRPEASRLVCYLEESLRDKSDTNRHIICHNIEHGLRLAGYEMKVCMDISLWGRSRHQQLSNLVNAHKAVCWLVRASSFKTQQWFMKQGIPVLVLGSCYPGICLPSLDIDYNAIGRHAAAMLWRLGHRQIGMLTPRTRFAGDIYCEQGFQSVLLQLGKKTISPGIFRHTDSMANVRRILDICFSKKPRPTALLIGQSRHALTVISYLMHKGIGVPRELSLVCRDDDIFLDHLILALARYRVDWNLFANRCVRMVGQLNTAGVLNDSRRYIQARFIRGDTLAPVRAVELV